MTVPSPLPNRTYSGCRPIVVFSSNTFRRWNVFINIKTFTHNSRATYKKMNDLRSPTNSMRSLYVATCDWRYCIRLCSKLNLTTRYHLQMLNVTIRTLSSTYLIRTSPPASSFQISVTWQHIFYLYPLSFNSILFVPWRILYTLSAMCSCVESWCIYYSSVLWMWLWH